MHQNEAPRPCDLLIRTALTITLDDAGSVVPQGGIAIDEGRILAVGPHDRLAAAYAPRRRLGSDRSIAMPGLVNTHNHTPLAIVRGMVEDRGIAPAYLPNVPQGDALSEEEAYLLSRLGVWELLRFGSTTVVDFYRHPAALARAAAEAGLRGFVGSRIMDVDPAALGRGQRHHDPARADTMLAEAADFAQAWQGRPGLITPVLGPHAADTCSAALLRDVAKLAHATGLVVHTHLHQSQSEVAYVRERDGCSPVQLMQQVGLLDASLVAGHCIWMDPDDIARFGASGAAVAHAPIGNAAHGSIAPVRDIEQAGGRVTLCTDSKSGDMFEALRIALCAARVRGAGFDIGSEDVLRWGTRSGAEALRLTDVGALAPGWRADVVLLDATMPNLRPLLNGPGLIVHSAMGANVDSAVIDGQVVMEGGRPTLFDPEEVVDAAQAVAERLWARAAA